MTGSSVHFFWKSVTQKIYTIHDGDLNQVNRSEDYHDKDAPFQEKKKQHRHIKNS